MELMNDSNLTRKLDQFLMKEELILRSEFREHQRINEHIKWSMVLSICLVLVGVFGLMLTGIFILGTFLDWWKASFIVTSIFLSVGGFLYGVMKEKEITSTNYPKRSLETLNELRNFIHSDSSTQH